MAERVGFEPTVELPRQQFSRLPDSAALAPLRDCPLNAGGMVSHDFRESIGRAYSAAMKFSIGFLSVHESVR